MYQALAFLHLGDQSFPLYGLDHLLAMATAVQLWTLTIRSQKAGFGEKIGMLHFNRVAT